MTSAHIALALLSGGAVGLSLGLIGGGGSILAVPLMVYVVGVASPHVAIGTSSIAVAASALISLLGHASSRNVKWPCALVFAIAGMAGATVGALAGKAVDDARLLTGFGVLMIVVAALMLKPRHGGDKPDVRLDWQSAKKLLPTLASMGFGAGALSGFFGIGGGFLIVPGLVSATSMPILNAIGSSLVSVAAFGATTAASYALSGMVDWPLAALFVLGGAVGGLAGMKLAARLATQRRLLTIVFSGVIAIVGCYVVTRGVLNLLT